MVVVVSLLGGVFGCFGWRSWGCGGRNRMRPLIAYASIALVGRVITRTITSLIRRIISRAIIALVIGLLGRYLDGLVGQIEIEEVHANISVKSNNKKKGNNHMDWYLYKCRHVIENQFNKIKNNRVIATRYEIR